MLCHKCPAIEGRSSGEWKLYTINGRDYVTVENVIRFYELRHNSILAGAARTESPAAKGLRLLSSDTREVYLSGVRHWLCFPTEEFNGKTMISRMDLVKTIEPVLRPHLIKGLEWFNTVVIDAGHGGHDRGAKSRFGFEKEYTLDTARRLKIVLEAAEFKTVMTRNSDVFIALDRRAAVANRLDKAIFVSIHFNEGAGNSAASGIEVFAITPRGAPSTADSSLKPSHLNPLPGNRTDAASVMLAASVHRALLANRGQIDRGVKRARFTVLATCQKPAILVEGGFLSNPSEARMIATTAYRSALARSIAKGILDFRELTLGKAPNASSGETADTEPVVMTKPRPVTSQKPTLIVTPPGE